MTEAEANVVLADLDRLAAMRRSRAADCGPGGYCSISLACNVGLTGFYCHTAKDSCDDERDCAGLPCAFDAKAWLCGTCAF